MKIMGILNVTPDSFSDGGRYFDTTSALDHAHQMVEDGAHIIDVGGESTRPGSARVGEEEEQRRVLPVVTELAKQGIAVSVDTMNASTMRACLEAGAQYINDVSAGQMEPDMLRLAAETHSEIILMHWRGLLSDAGAVFHYDNVVEEVREELSQRVDVAVDAGVNPGRIIVDPGLGFSKNAQHNWTLMSHLDRLASLGPRLLVAGSRKRFLSSHLEETGAEVDERNLDIATSALTGLACHARAWGVRVHDVRTSAVVASVTERALNG